MVHCLTAIWTGVFGSIPALQDDLTRIDRMSRERVGGTGNKGGCEAVLITCLLITAELLTGCNVLGAVRFCMGSSIEGREEVAHVETAGAEHVRGTGIIGSKDECIDTFIHLLLMTAFLIGCCIVFDTIFDGGDFISPFEG